MTQEVINKLREYGGYSKNGKMSDEAVVPKELLNQAADLLEHKSKENIWYVRSAPSEREKRVCTILEKMKTQKLSTKIKIDRFTKFYRG